MLRRPASTIVAIGLLLFLAIESAGQGRPEPPELRAEISRASAALFEAFNACDLDTFAAAFTDSPEFYARTPHRPCHRPAARGLR